MLGQRSLSPKNQKPRSVAKWVSCSSRKTTLYRRRLEKKEKNTPISWFYRWRISALTREDLRPAVSHAVLLPNVILLASILGDLNHIIGSKIDDISVEYFKLAVCRGSTRFLIVFSYPTVAWPTWRDDYGSHARILEDWVTLNLLRSRLLIKLRCYIHRFAELSTYNATVPTEAVNVHTANFM